MSVTNVKGSAGPKPQSLTWSRHLNKVIEQIARFWRVYYTVLVVGLRVPGQRRWIGALWFFEFATAFCQGLILATLAAGVRLASRADQFSVSVLGMMPSLKAIFGDSISPPTIIAGAVVLSSAFLVASVASRYLAAITSRRMGRNFHRHLAATVLRMANGGRLVPIDHVKSRKEMHFAATRNAIHVSKAFEVIAKLVPIAVFCVFFYAVTFAFIWEVSVIIGLAVCLLLPVCIHVSRRIHTSSNSYFNLHAQRFVGQIGSALAGIDAYFAPALSRRTGISRQEAFLHTSEAKDYFDHFDAVQLASARMNFMTGVVKALIFAVGVASLCAVALIKQLDYFVITVFATSLYVSFNFLQSLLANLATMNVYYPQASAFYGFVTAWAANSQFDRQPLTTNATSGSAPAVFRSQGPKSKFGAEYVDSAKVRPGSTIDLVTPGPIGRFNVKHWLEPLAQASKDEIYSDSVVLFNASPVDLSPLMLSDLDAALKQRTGRRLQEVIDCFSSQDAVVNWLDKTGKGSEDLILSYETLKQANSDVRCVLYIAASMASPTRHVFLDGSLFKSKPCTQLNELLPDRIVFVWRTTASDPMIDPDWRFLIKGGRLAAILGGESNLQHVRDFYPQPGSVESLEVDDITVLG